MFYALHLNIKVGKYRFTRAESVVVERNRDSLKNTCVIKIPVSAVVKKDGQHAGTAETAKIIKKRDTVTVELGYHNSYGKWQYKEFTGWVRQIHPNIPLEIECDDINPALRDENLSHTFSQTTLKRILKYILSSSKISIEGTVPELSMQSFYLNNITPVEALEKLKDEYGLVMYFTDGKLYTGLAYTDNRGAVIYNLNGNECNTLKSSDLKWVISDDIKIRVKAIHIHKNNTKTEVEIGDKNGSLRTLYFYDVESQAELKRLAQSRLDEMKFDGYQGSINTFLLPYCNHGFTATVRDELFPDRAGKYFVESVKTEWGVKGARRKIELGPKVS